MIPGPFIVIEGPNYSGKSTLIAGLTAHFQSLGIEPVVTREPGGTKFGETLRAALKTTHGVTPLAQGLAMNAARAQHNHEVILPALAKGRPVLCDRYIDSTRVYQMVMGKVSMPEAEILLAIHNNLRQPDLTIYLLPDRQLLLKRWYEKRKGRTETDVFETDALHELEIYRSIAFGNDRAICLEFVESQANQLPSWVITDPKFTHVCQTS